MHCHEGSLTCSSGVLLEEAVLASTWWGFPSAQVDVSRSLIRRIGLLGKIGPGKPMVSSMVSGPLDRWMMVNTHGFPDVSGVEIFPNQNQSIDWFHWKSRCPAAASTLMKSQSATVAVTDQDHGLQNCEVRRGKRNACPWSQWLLLLGPSLSEVGAFENGLSPAKCTRNRENVGNPLPYAQTPRWLSHFDYHFDVFTQKPSTTGCQPSTKVRWIVSLRNITIHDSWVCLKIGYFPNYSHLIGIMIINHWV